MTEKMIDIKTVSTKPVKLVVPILTSVVIYLIMPVMVIVINVAYVIKNQSRSCYARAK